MLSLTISVPEIRPSVVKSKPAVSSVKNDGVHTIVFGAGPQEVTPWYIIVLAHGAGNGAGGGHASAKSLPPFINSKAVPVINGCASP